jgi:CarD family transcriptional regulator
MELAIGQKVAYPNQGVCLVEAIKQFNVGGRTVSGYSLRVLGDNSTIFVPKDNAASVGLRPLISTAQCRRLIDRLSEDFEPISCDWKTRSKEFADMLRSGDVFQAADVLKMLTYLSREKKLSFREQNLLEKAKFLIVSEVTNAAPKIKMRIEREISDLVEAACTKHSRTQPRVMQAAH